MDFAALLDESLALVMRQRCEDAIALVVAEESGASDEASLAAFLSVLTGDAEEAIRWAAMARHGAREGEPEEVALAAGASAFVVALVGEERAGYDPARLPVAAAALAITDRVSAFAGYLLVESALAGAYVGIATQLVPDPAPHTFWERHSYGAVMAACRARAAAFAGRIDEATAVLDAHDDTAPGLGSALVRATRALIAGNAGDREQLATRIGATLAMVGELPIEPIDYIGRGIHLLVSYGVVALGDKRGAAHALLRAGGDACLSQLILIDRAIGLETLVAAALEVEDLDSARGWLEQSRPLRPLRACAPAVERTESRLALVEGRAVDALAHARTAWALSTPEGRVIEAAESEILMSRALIALGETTQAREVLRATVAAGDAAGFGAFRQSASRTLRVAGRRLPPVAGGGWAALSLREREVAERLLAGAEPAEVAAELYLSPATVRVHTSRVLAAFGVASRIGLLSAVRCAPTQPRELPQLTPRQHEVATLVAMDHSNAAIAERLGVSVKAVDRHVGEIRRRLGATTRFAVALWWWSAQA